MSSQPHNCIDLTSDDDHEEHYTPQPPIRNAPRPSRPRHGHLSLPQGVVLHPAVREIPMSADAGGRLPANDWMAHAWPPEVDGDNNIILGCPERAHGYANNDPVIIDDNEEEEQQPRPRARKGNPPSASTSQERQKQLDLENAMATRAARTEKKQKERAEVNSPQLTRVVTLRPTPEINLSTVKANAVPPSTLADTASDQPSACVTTDPSVSKPSFSLTGLDRQQMEAERLARLKRKREQDENKPEEATNKTRGRTLVREQRERSKTVSISPPPLRRKNKAEAQSSEPNTGTAAGTGAEALQPTSSSTSSVSTYFPAGKVLQTYLPGFPTTNTTSFPQLIGPKDSLTSCLLSSFTWDFDWLFPHFATTRTKFQLVMHAKFAAQRDALREDFQGVNNVRLCFPSMDGLVNCMHSKLMLLFYNAEDLDIAMAMSMPSDSSTSTSARWEGPRCRIVVPTANLVGNDWGAGGIMENTVFLIDLPVKGRAFETTNSAEEGEEEGKTSFQKSLITFLRAQTVPGDVISKLEHFDFASTSDLGFVHTIGGVHVGQSWRTTGLSGLGRTVTEMGLATTAATTPPQLDYVTSSVGSLGDGFMAAMYLAAQGDDGLTEYTHRATAKSNRTQSTLVSLESAGRRHHRGLPHGSAPLAVASTAPAPAPAPLTLTLTVTDDWRDNFRFYFPSESTVKVSTGGPTSAGTICFSRKWWENAKFPRENMRDCVSLRAGCLMHNKLLFVRYASPLSTHAGKLYRGWAYVGSANLSESAWGQLLQDKTTKSPKLNCRNWECGVVIPVPEESSDARTPTCSSINGPSPLSKVVPIPMRYPAESFDRGKPWLFSE